MKSWKVLLRSIMSSLVETHLLNDLKEKHTIDMFDKIMFEQKYYKVIDDYYIESSIVNKKVSFGLTLYVKHNGSTEYKKYSMKAEEGK